MRIWRVFAWPFRIFCKIRGACLVSMDQSEFCETCGRRILDDEPID